MASSWNSSKPFVCNICGVRYKLASSLRSHKKSHTDETFCYTCNKNFSSKGNLKTHLKYVHNVQLKTKSKIQTIGDTDLRII
ncbi:unnamed protein product [Bemisia tabaci]|uniref:C2H2-type domain-containing protein n=1 Tax=Bemisia tabaci TaxID=7038 RepID=A0A9P0AEW3_BEMTA|nr:unnamed protein product [Bemisia tabaci]